MAVFKSDLVTNEDAGTMNEKHTQGLLKNINALLELASTSADNDVHLMLRIPVDANITELYFASDDLGSTGDFNVGFYPVNGTVITAVTDTIDEDALASAIDVNTAAVAKIDIRYEVQNIDSLGERAWELAGLSSKPDYAYFYIALTNTAATTAAGTVTLSCNYV